MVCIARQGDLQGRSDFERVEGQFNEYRSGSGTRPSAGKRDAPRNFRLLSTLAADDPVANAMRASARRMIGVAVFSGVINIQMLSGSLYMLQVYDRVIPSRNLATLFGLSLMVLIAYLVQGYFDAMRSRMLAGSRRCSMARCRDRSIRRSPPCRCAG
jgi:hypothetical protein